MEMQVGEVARLRVRILIRASDESCEFFCVTYLCIALLFTGIAFLCHKVKQYKSGQ